MIGLAGLIIFDTWCVRLGWDPSPHLVPCSAFKPVVSFLFPRHRVLGLTVLSLPVPPGPSSSCSASVNMRSCQLLCSWSSSGASGKTVSMKAASDLQATSSCSVRANIPQCCVHMCASLVQCPSRQKGYGSGMQQNQPPRAWNARLPSPVSFLNFPTQLNAHLAQEAFPAHHFLQSPLVTAHHSFGSCLAASHITG